MTLAHIGKSIRTRVIGTVSFIAVLGISFWYVNGCGSTISLHKLLTVINIWFAYALYEWVSLFYKNHIGKKKAYLLCIGTGWIVCAWYAMTSMHNRLFYLLCTAMMTDTLAYIAGMFCGGRKLCPTVSPGKTWSGSIISTLATTLIIGTYYPQYSMGVCMMLSIGTQGGDLLQSYTKRILGIKNTGNIFGDHGGMLDRIDGWMGASILWYIYAYFI